MISDEPEDLADLELERGRAPSGGNWQDMLDVEKVGSATHDVVELDQTQQPTLLQQEALHQPSANKLVNTSGEPSHDTVDSTVGVNNQIAAPEVKALDAAFAQVSSSKSGDGILLKKDGKRGEPNAR